MRFLSLAPLFLSAFLYAEPLTLDLSCVIPAPDQAVENVTVRARLYVYDPRLADHPAKEVDRMDQTEVTFAKGEATTLTFPSWTIQSEPGSYYVTVFVHPTVDSKERLYYINGFQKVFQNGPKETLKVTLTPRRK